MTYMGDMLDHILSRFRFPTSGFSANNAGLTLTRSAHALISSVRHGEHVRRKLSPVFGVYVAVLVLGRRPGYWIIKIIKLVISPASTFVKTSIFFLWFA